MQDLNNLPDRLLHYYVANSPHYTCYQFAMAQALDAFHPEIVRQIFGKYDLQRDTSDFFVRVLNGIIKEAYAHRAYYPDFLNVQDNSLSDIALGIETILERDGYFILFHIDEDFIEINHAESYGYDGAASLLYYIDQHDGRFNLWKKGKFEEFFLNDNYTKLSNGNLLMFMLRRRAKGYPERRVPVISKNSVSSITVDKLAEIIEASKLR